MRQWASNLFRLAADALAPSAAIRPTIDAIRSNQAYDVEVALAGPPSRPTQLGDLPICADSIDRLDKALSDRDEAYSRELSRLREIAGPKLYAAYRELAGLKVLRRLLDTQEGATLKAKLCALNKMLDPEDEPYDY